MSNEYWADYFLPDLSSTLKIMIEQMQESARKMAESLLRVQDAIKPLSDTLNNALPKSLNIDLPTCFSRPFLAVRRMGEAQFVYWDTIPDEMIDTLYESQNVNKTLREFLGKKQFQPIEETVEKTCSHLKNKQQLRVYQQSVEAFKAGQFDLAVLGFMSVFDSVLSAVSRNITTSLSKRIGVIIDKIKKQNVLGQEEHSIVVLGFTLEKTLETFAADSRFSEKEPKTLNRHWIAHGRSLRKKTKLDCVKMIHLVYGLLIVGDLDKTEKSAREDEQ